jgi:hypothetical protein
VSEELGRGDWALSLPRIPLSWSHYVRLLSANKPEARAFYETGAKVSPAELAGLHLGQTASQQACRGEKANGSNQQPVAQQVCGNALPHLAAHRQARRTTGRAGPGHR